MATAGVALGAPPHKKLWRMLLNSTARLVELGLMAMKGYGTGVVLATRRGVGGEKGMVSN